MTIFQIAMVAAVIYPLVGRNIFARDLRPLSSTEVSRFIAGTLFLALGLPAITLGSAFWLLSNGADIGTQAVSSMKQSQLYVESHLRTLLPDHGWDCRQIILSRAVEDEWQRAFYKASCNDKYALCARDEMEYLTRIRPVINPKGQAAVDLDVIGQVSAVAGTAAKTLSGQDVKFQGQNCAGLMPASWISAERPVLNRSMRLCLGECS